MALFADEVKVSKYTLDPLSIFLTINSALVLMLLAVLTQDPSITRIMGIYMGIFAVITAVGFLIRGEKPFTTIGKILSIKTFGREKVEVGLLSAPAAYAAITIVMFTVITAFPYLAITFAFTLPNITPQLLYMSGGMIEEYAFRFVLLSFHLEGRKPFPAFNFPIAIGINSFEFALWHIGVYGTSNALLIGVFFSSVVMGIFYWFTHRLWVTQLAHGAINFTATSQFIIPQAQIAQIITFVWVIIIGIRLI